MSQACFCMVPEHQFLHLSEPEMVTKVGLFLPAPFSWAELTTSPTHCPTTVNTLFPVTRKETEVKCSAASSRHYAWREPKRSFSGALCSRGTGSLGIFLNSSCTAFQCFLPSSNPTENCLFICSFSHPQPSWTSLLQTLNPWGRIYPRFMFAAHRADLDH